VEVIAEPSFLKCFLVLNSLLAIGLAGGHWSVSLALRQLLEKPHNGLIVGGSLRLAFPSAAQLSVLASRGGVLGVDSTHGFPLGMLG
jgi:hypothetical protein